MRTYSAISIQASGNCSIEGRTDRKNLQDTGNSQALSDQETGKQSRPAPRRSATKLIMKMDIRVRSSGAASWIKSSSGDWWSQMFLAGRVVLGTYPAIVFQCKGKYPVHRFVLFLSCFVLYCFVLSGLEPLLRIPAWTLNAIALTSTGNTVTHQFFSSSGATLRPLCMPDLTNHELIICTSYPSFPMDACHRFDQRSVLLMIIGALHLWLIV
jgi:hypothetical protein